MFFALSNFFHDYIFSVDTTSVADTRNNPSIGEGSVGGLTGSLSASGSHMDRLGAIRDNLSETASTMALAGASITGSLSGSAMVNYLNRYRASKQYNRIIIIFFILSELYVFLNPPFLFVSTSPAISLY